MQSRAPTTMRLRRSSREEKAPTVFEPCCAVPACAICFEEYAASDKLWVCERCANCVHADCMNRWRKYNKTCPYCRHAPETGASQEGVCCILMCGLALLSALSPAIGIEKMH